EGLSTRHSKSLGQLAISACARESTHPDDAAFQHSNPPSYAHPDEASARVRRHSGNHASPEPDAGQLSRTGKRGHSPTSCHHNHRRVAKTYWRGNFNPRHANDPGGPRYMGTTREGSDHVDGTCA